MAFDGVFPASSQNLRHPRARAAPEAGAIRRESELWAWAALGNVLTPCLMALLKP